MTGRFREARVGSETVYIKVQWPDGKAEGNVIAVCSMTNSNDGCELRIEPDIARELVEALHEAIRTVTGLEE